MNNTTSVHLQLRTWYLLTRVQRPTLADCTTTILDVARPFTPLVLPVMNPTLPDVYLHMGVRCKAELVHFTLQPAGFFALTSAALQHVRSCLRRR